jgi:SAM-dependent methyltransferase
MMTGPVPDIPRSAPIPPEVYDLAFGWDPTPEIERLLLGCRSAGLTPGSALELGCGTGRLLRALAPRIPDLCGLDLSPEMIAYARGRTAATLAVADMSRFSLGRQFDLIYTSANTIRCVTEPDALTRMWSCIADHLHPGGVFIADLELGLAAEAAQLGQPIAWTLSREQIEVRVTWTVIEPPSPATRCCRVEWTFEIREGETHRRWREDFPLRTYDADEFLRLATADGRLAPRFLYLLRDPYLFDTPPENAAGRTLAVLQRL